MVRVSIDVGALRGVVSTVNTFATTASTESQAVTSMASWARTDAPSLSGVAAMVTRVKDRATELSDRVDLAILVNGGDEGFSGTVSYDIPYDTGSSTRRMIGEQLAVQFANLPDNPTAEELARLQDLAGILGRHSDDDWVLGNMFEDLGPEGTLSVATQLDTLFDNWDQGDAQYTDDTWPNAPDGSDMHLTEYIREVQQSVMETFGTALGNATNGSYLPSDFGTQLATYATENRGANPWALSQTLRFGDYEAEFLTDIGDHLYEFEIENDTGLGLWGPMMGDERPLLGTSDQDGYYDPFVGLFSAMSRTPEAALEFFAADGMTDERVSYFVEDRTFKPDGGNTLFEALDAGTTTFREPGDGGQSARAAWLMSQVVDELAARDGDPAIPDGAKDSLGHMFATYIVDVDAVAQGADRDPNWYDPQETQPWMADLPLGAGFSREDLNEVLSEVLTDPEAVEQIGNAAREWNGYRIGMAAEGYDGSDGGSAGVRSALYNGSLLNGYVLGNMEVGTEDAATDADERAQMYIGLAGDLAGLVPLPGANFTGDFVGFLADQAINQGKDFAEGEFADNLGRANGENLTVQQTAIVDQQIAMVRALEDELPPGATTDESGNTYPWFSEDGELLDPAANPDLRADFVQWANSGEVGDFMTGLIPDINGQFSQGLGVAGADD